MAEPSVASLTEPTTDTAGRDIGAGVALPRTAQQQYDATTKLAPGVIARSGSSPSPDA